MLIIKQPEFHTSVWQTALPEAQILNHTQVPTTLEQRVSLFKQHSIVILLSEIPDWENLMLALRSSGVYWIIISRNTSTNEFRQTASMGARGYLDALSHPETLKAAVASVQSGALWIPEPFMSELMKSISVQLPQVKEPDLSSLSKKEAAVAKLMTQGSSNKEIAETLHVTERTIKSHLTQIYNKLNVRDRMQLMLYMQGHDLSNDKSA